MCKFVPQADQSKIKNARQYRAFQKDYLLLILQSLSKGQRRIFSKSSAKY